MFGGRGGGRRATPPQKGQNLEQEISVPFATAVLGGQYQVSFDRGHGKIENVTVKIPVGIESGKKIRLKGQGRSGPGGDGDLLVKVNISGHPNYSRNGLNLSVTAPITLLEAAQGAKIDLPTPHGTIAVTVPPGTSSGKSLRLKNMGIKTKDRAGDLIVKLQIVIPDTPTDGDKELLAKLDAAWNNPDARAELVW